MTYATASSLLNQFGAEEIAQRADRGMPRLVSGEMLLLATASGDLTGYTTPEQDATAAALEIINNKLLDAEGMVNGYLSGRYEVPLVTVPRLVVSATCDIVRYALYDDIATEQITKRYNDAIKLLEQISKGVVSLGIDDTGSKPVASAGAQMTSVGKVFGRDGSFI